MSEIRKQTALLVVSEQVLKDLRDPEFEGLGIVVDGKGFCADRRGNSIRYYQLELEAADATVPPSEKAATVAATAANCRPGQPY